MSTIVNATFSGGMFVPSVPVELQEGARVELTVTESTGSKPNPRAGFDFEAWSKRAAALRQQIFNRVGYLPDSALEVAEDRRRDE